MARKRREDLLYIWILIILLIWITKVAIFVEDDDDTDQQSLSIFILAGQSNMAGRGGVSNRSWDGYVPQECYPRPSILRLNAELRWEQAEEPLHADIDVSKTCGVGPGIVFANTILSKDSSFRAVGLVPCAVGGSRINEWLRGSRLYDQLVRRGLAAVEDGRGILEGVLWYQGETDTISEGEADSYKVKFERLVEDLRTDLHSPLLPVFQVVLASAEGQFMEEVREAQLGVDLSNVQTVDAKGLPLSIDGLHLATQGQVQLGKLLAEEFLKFRTTQRDLVHSS